MLRIAITFICSCRNNNQPTHHALPRSIMLRRMLPRLSSTGMQLYLEEPKYHFELQATEEGWGVVKVNAAMHPVYNLRRC